MKRIIPAVFLIIFLFTPGCSANSKQAAGFVSSKELSRTDFIFIMSKNDEEITDETDMTMPSYNDIVSINKNIDENGIRFYVTVRGMPETLTINHSGLSAMVLEYCWYIGFDSDGDGKIDYNATLNHDRFWERGKKESEASVDSDAFRTVVLQHAVSSDYTVCEASFEMDGDTMVFYVEKNGDEDLQKITEDTPFYVYSQSRTAEYYFCDILPKK